MNKSANVTNSPQSDPNYRSHVTIIAQFTSLVVLGVIIALGNLTSIVIFLKTGSLRKRSHCLIISLSVADFLVSGVVFMAANYFLKASKWDVKNDYIIVLEFFDLLTGMASIHNLASIALERFYAIVFPIRHRLVGQRFYVMFVFFPWVTAGIQTLIDLIRFIFPSAFPLYRYTNVTIPALALIIISISYLGIGIKVRRNRSIPDNQNRALRDQKLTVTLLIVTLASLVTWIPLQCLTVVAFFCPECLIFQNVIFVMKFLQYCNSGINVFIYILRIPQFRSRFYEVLCGKKRKRKNDTQPSTIDMSIINKGYSVKKRTNSVSSKVQRKS